jgi:hypothetical protein
MTHMIEATGVVERFRDTTALDGLELGSAAACSPSP